MAEKNYRTVAVVPEMPRTIDEQQLHVYTPVGSVNNFGVFKPDGQQFVIVNGVLRADVTKLIQLADPPAIVTEDDGDVGVDIAFTEPDSTLNRKFQFTFKNIKGATGATGATGLSALQTTYSWTAFSKPVVDTTTGTQNSYFSRTPVVGDTFIAVYRYLATDRKTILGVYLVYCEITSVDESTTSCNFKLVKFQEIPIKYITQITGPVTEGLNDMYTVVFSDGTTYDFVVTNGAQGPAGATGAQGEQGPKGDDGVSITSVTQTGIDGGTRVTITLSDGQTTSFDVMNGINTNFQVVDVLPTTNISTSTIYLVPSTTPGEENVYDEYIYVNGNWEHIGSTSVDLSDYVTKTYFNQNVGDATKNYVVAQMSKIQNLYIEMYESGSVPAVGQALTLTNANFARVPAQGQYFALIELVNTKDKYYSICKIASVDTTTCSATVEAVTELDSGTEIEAIKASIQALTTTVNGKLDKVTASDTYRRVYVIRADGAQGTLPSTSGAIPSTIIERDATGRAKVVDGEDNSDIATVGQMNTAIEAAVSGLERTDNKVGSITGEGSDVQYPSTKAVVDYVKANAPTANFITLRTTSGTLSDEDFAKLDSDANSYILLAYSGQQYKLLKNVTSTTDLVYSVVNDEQEYKITILLSDKSWGLQVITFENTANRVTEIKASSADEEYPSAAATYTYGQTVLTAAKAYADTAIANAITTALNTPV